MSQNRTAYKKGLELEDMCHLNLSGNFDPPKKSFWGITMAIFSLPGLLLGLLFAETTLAQNHLRIFCESTSKTEEIRKAITDKQHRIGARSFVIEQKSDDCQMAHIRRPMFEKKEDGSPNFKRPVPCNGESLKRLLNEKNLRSLPPRNASDRWPLHFRAYFCEDCSFHKKEGEKFVPLPMEEVRRVAGELKQKAQNQPYDYEKPLEPGYIDFYGEIEFSIIGVKEKPRGYALKIFNNTASTGASDKFASALVAPQDAQAKYKDKLISDRQVYNCFPEEVVANEPPTVDEPAKETSDKAPATQD